MVIDNVPLVNSKANIVNNVTFIENVATDKNGGGIYLENVG